MRTIEHYLPDHPFFAKLDPEALAVVAGCATNVSFAPGEFLFREGQPANQFFVIRRGRVALQVHGPSAGTVVVDTADAGDVLGWSWLVPPYVWLFDARAAERTGDHRDVAARASTNQAADAEASEAADYRTDPRMLIVTQRPGGDLFDHTLANLHGAWLGSRL